MRYTVLTDDDVRRVMPMSAAVDRIESALREHAEGTMVAPPRFRVDVDKGALIFTAGAVTHYDKAVGFRVYDRFQESHASHGQVVVVFDSDTGDFKGVIVGGHLGAMRTGAIGGVAIKHMARPDACRAAILGSGRQARTHLEAAAVVRHFASVKVYSPNATHREAFASEMRETLDLHVDPVLSAQEAVADADVVICVTKSTTPVFDPSWLKPGAHVNTVGPRAQGESELDASIAGRVRSSPQTRYANSGVMPHRISLPIPPGWRPWLNWEILWWGSTRDATPPMTLPCSARQASQAPRSPSPAKRSDGRVIVRGLKRSSTSHDGVGACRRAIHPAPCTAVPTSYKTGTLPLDSTTWPVKEETMRQTMILTGEINLKTVTDPTVPFGRVTKELGEADLVFANLECLLADPPAAYATNQAAFHTTREGFYAGPVAGEALKLAGFDGVGCANNVTYGEDAIRASLARLKELGIPVTGAGLNREEAHRPLIIEKRGVRFGFMQRTSIFWPRGQAAGPLSPGVATLAAHTAYQPRVANRAGVPPIILTMADDTELDEYIEELTELRPQVDILISSHHWGLRGEVLQYQKQIAHAAVDAGADIIMGHGVHAITPIEVYKDKPIFYGLGCFSFNEGHGGRDSTFEAVNWLGLLARVTIEDKQVVKVTCVPVRHNKANETLIRSATDERDEMDKLIAASKKLGASLTMRGDELVVIEKQGVLA